MKGIKDMAIYNIYCTIKSLICCTTIMLHSTEKYKNLSDVELKDKAYDFLIKLLKKSKECDDLFYDECI